MARDHEQLDVYEMERMVARALIALVDEGGVTRPVTARLLASHTRLPLHRVREVLDEWQLRTLSGDALYLTSEALDQAHKLAQQG